MKVDDNGIVRDMNETELANLAQIQAETEAQAKVNADRAKLKTATLKKLGLSEDEFAALLS